MNKHASIKRIVCIGGGTGTFVVLRGLKEYPYHLSAIVTMADSGGSNKRIRDEFGLLPTSDIRQCFVALSDENGGAGLLRKLFIYRFKKGTGISGMTFGNLFMAALSDILGSQAEAISQTRKVLRIKGTVIPVSYTKTNLMAMYEDGTVASEEHVIDEPPHDGKLRITRAYLQPPAVANPQALEAIAKSDMIVLGPGDLYTSLIPNLLVQGISDALKKSKGRKVYIMNLMTKWGQTYNFTARDHIRVLSDYLRFFPDVVIVNSAPLIKSAVALYAKGNELPVVDDLSGGQYKIIRAPVASSRMTTKIKSDTLIRSFIRHDSDKLANVLVGLV